MCGCGVNLFLPRVKKLFYLMQNIFSIEIFHKNLDLLRGIAKIGKGEFNALLRVGNAYRPKLKSIGAKMSRAISDNFQGVDDKWLLTEHPEGAVGITFAPRKTNQGPMKQEPVKEETGKIDLLLRLIDEQAASLRRLEKDLEFFRERGDRHSDRMKEQGDTIDRLAKRLDVVTAALIQAEKQRDFLPLKVLTGGG